MDFEVLAPGTHNGKAFSEADLDQMVDNFAALKPYVKPPLKVGHSSNQVLAGQSDGDPALGWCSGLRRVGQKLVGTFVGIPEKFAQLIRAGRYLRGSSEVHLDWAKSPDEANLKTGVAGKVLTGFAVLGADVPAVKNLDDLASFLGAESALCFSEPATDTERVETPLHLRTYAAGSVSDFEECVRTAVYAAFPGSDVYVRDVFPDRVIVEHRDGLHEHAITTTAPGGCIIGPKQPVQVAYVALKGSHAPESHDASDGLAKEHPMADQDHAAKLADLESKLTALLSQHDADKAAHAAALADRDAKIAKLSEDAQGAREREAAAESRARHAEAVDWVARFSQAGNLRILPTQRALATVLRDRLVAADATVTADALTGCFSEGETPRALSLAELFERYIQAQPDHKIALTTVTQHEQASESAEAWLTERATKLGKNAKDPVVRREMTLLMLDERPDLARAMRATA